MAQPLDTVFAEYGDRYSFAEQQVLIEQDTKDRQVYIICSGMVKKTLPIKHGPRVWLTDLEPGALAGSVAAMTGEPTGFEFSTLMPTEVIGLPEARFMDLVREDAAFAEAVAIDMACRMLDSSRSISEQLSLPVIERLHQTLLRLGEAQSSSACCATLLEPVPSVKELSQRIHASRESTSRALSSLRQSGVVTVTGGCMRVRPGVDDRKSG